MDTIGDFLTIIRNASAVFNPSCIVRGSRMNKAILQILKNEGYISGFEAVTDSKGHPAFEVFLKYVNGTKAISMIKRISTPGCRLYYGHDKLPKVLGGLGISIVTTSQGVMKDSHARSRKLGGELLCQVY